MVVASSEEFSFAVKEEEEAPRRKNKLFRRRLSPTSVSFVDTLQKSMSWSKPELFKRPLSWTATSDCLERTKKTLFSTKEPTMKDFKKVRVLGRGAFGRVYLVQQKEQLYACKIVSKAKVAYARGELAVLDRLRHPLIIKKIYGIRSPSKNCLITVYARRGTLADATKSWHYNDISSEKRLICRRAAAEVACALAYVHSMRVMHRDVKPRNVLVDDDGHCVLSDFGLAVCDATFLTGDKTFVGTLEYLAPELLLGKAYGRAVDWWAFGVLLFELFTGKTPFVNTKGTCRGLFENILHLDFSKVNVVSGDARPFLDHLLQKDPLQRFGSDLTAFENIHLFHGLDWHLVNQRRSPPPFPALLSNDDLLSSSSGAVVGGKNALLVADDDDEPHVIDLIFTDPSSSCY